MRSLEVLRPGHPAAIPRTSPSQADIFPPSQQLWKIGSRNSTLSSSPGKPKQEEGTGFGLQRAKDELSGPPDLGQGRGQEVRKKSPSTRSWRGLGLAPEWPCSTGVKSLCLDLPLGLTLALALQGAIHYPRRGLLATVNHHSLLAPCR